MKKFLLVLFVFSMIANMATSCSKDNINTKEPESELLVAANNLEVSSSTKEILENIYDHDVELFRFICYSFLSTESLIYPRARDFFPEFKEFEQCEDASRALLAEYIKTDIDLDKNLSEFERYKAHILAFLISRPVYLEKLTYEEIDLLIEAEREKNKVRMQYINDGHEGGVVLFGLDFSSQNRDRLLAQSEHFTYSDDFWKKYDYINVALTANDGISSEAN